VTFLRVPETLSDEILGKMHAPPKADDVEATADMLTEYDGIMFGLPTRFGMAAGQMKAFMDSTGGLWQKGALVGKPAGVFFSTATQNGGQETYLVPQFRLLTGILVLVLPCCTTGLETPSMMSLTFIIFPPSDRFISTFREP